MNKKAVGQALFIIGALVLAVVGISYGSGLLFLKLHKVPWEGLTPFAIWDYWSVYRSHPDKFVRFTVNGCAFGPYVILLCAPILVFLGRKQRSLHGDARFATMAEVRKAGLIDPKNGLDKTILVGKFKDKYLTYGGYQFVMLAAPTRSGKGVGVVIPNCLNYSDSLVVLDIKLENFDITSGFRAAHGQEVYLFSPFDTKGRTHRYNPLEYISSDPAERIGDIDAIGTALYSGGNENDKFWSENAKDLFRGLCLMVLEHPKLPKTLGEILRQASGKGKPFAEHIREMIEEAQNENRPFSSSCVDALNRIINNSENTLAGIVSTFNGPLLIFQNPRVDLATSANDFDLRDVRRKRMTIYLGVTPDKLKDAAVIVNLFFDQLLNLNTRTLPQQDKSLKFQCLLILDEFTAIGKVAMIQQAISYQAGYNMRVLTIIQNKSQLEDKYGKAGALTLMANHALMVMYAPSPVVQSDANEYSEMLGYQTVKNKNKSRSFASSIGGQGSRSESESDQRRALMLPQELKELGQWREIVSLENCKPILCDKIKYFEDPAFMQRINWQIPAIPIQDVDTFVAKLNDCRRDIEKADLEDPNLAEKTAGVEELPDMPENVAELSEDDIAEFAADTAEAIVNAIIQDEPIDKEKYHMGDEQAAKLASDMFGGGDDDEEDNAIEVVDGPQSEEPKQSKDNNEVQNMLDEMGFVPVEDEGIAEESEESPAEDAQAMQHEAGEGVITADEPIDQTDELTPEEPKPDFAQSEPSNEQTEDTEQGNENNEIEQQQEESANQEIQDEKVLPSFGLDNAQEPAPELGPEDRQVLDSFGLNDNQGEHQNE